jgi:hypothetical protein
MEKSIDGDDFDTEATKKAIARDTKHSKDF